MLVEKIKKRILAILTHYWEQKSSLNQIISIKLSRDAWLVGAKIAHDD